MDQDGVVPHDEQRRLFDAMLANRAVRELRDRWHEDYVEAERRVTTNIKNQRLRSGLSQEQVASSLRMHNFDFHQSTVAKVESGKRPLRIAELFAFADVLDTPWTALLEGGRDIDIVPGDAMLPVDTWEANLEELILKRDDVMSELVQGVEEHARRYAEWDRMILIRISALANAAAQASREGHKVDRKRIDGLVERWTEQAASSAMSRARFEETADDRRRFLDGLERERAERQVAEDEMWREFSEWRRAKGSTNRS